MFGILQRVRLPPLWGKAARLVRRTLRGSAGALAAFLTLSAVQAQTLTTAETGHFTGPDRIQRLIAGAKKEGTLTLYSSAQVAVMTAVGKAFEAKYGVKVNLWRGASEQIFQRVQAEARANRLVADVMETAGPTWRPSIG